MRAKAHAAGFPRPQLGITDGTSSAQPSPSTAKHYMPAGTLTLTV